MPQLIRAHRIGKTFEGTSVLQNLSLTVLQGEIICLLGPTGAGKTTLLRCLNLLDLIDDGFIEYGGHRVIETGTNENGNGNGNGNGHARRRRRRVHVHPDRFRRKFGFVFRSQNLLPTRTVLENMIEGPVYALRQRRADAERHALDLLDVIHLGHRAQSYPDALPPEERQRIAVARALGMKPEILLMDEITSDLYPPQVVTLLQTIRDLRAIHNAAMIIVTHHLEFASRIADRVWYIEDGRMIEDGPPSLLGQPVTAAFGAYLAQVRSAR
ncbi:MAG: ATP-binding cassette domain-containing protein [Planctomycetota bacterium]|jgi:polar amino acid transport system ATP-binding protein